MRPGLAQDAAQGIGLRYGGDNNIRRCRRPTRVRFIPYFDCVFTRNRASGIQTAIQGAVGIVFIQRKLITACPSGYTETEGLPGINSNGSWGDYKISIYLDSFS